MVGKSSSSYLLMVMMRSCLNNYFVAVLLFFHHQHRICISIPSYSYIHWIIYPWIPNIQGKTGPTFREVFLGGFWCPYSLKANSWTGLLDWPLKFFGWESLQSPGRWLYISWLFVFPLLGSFVVKVAKRTSFLESESFFGIHKQQRFIEDESDKACRLYQLLTTKSEHEIEAVTVYGELFGGMIHKHHYNHY